MGLQVQVPADIMCTFILQVLFRSEHNVEGSQNTRTEFHLDESELDGFPKGVFNEHQLQMSIKLIRVKSLKKKKKEKKVWDLKFLHCVR